MANTNYDWYDFAPLCTVSADFAVCFNLPIGCKIYWKYARKLIDNYIRNPNIKCEYNYNGSLTGAVIYNDDKLDKLFKCKGVRYNYMISHLIDHLFKDEKLDKNLHRVYDYSVMKESHKELKEQIIARAWRPERIAWLLENGFDPNDL